MTVAVNVTPAVSERPDEDYLTGYARNQQQAAVRREYDDRCAYCRHLWHGLACAGCLCATSYRESA